MWTGRQLTGATYGSNSYSFTYDDNGIRTSKTKNGVKTTYYVSGATILGEETNGNITVYFYDDTGAPIGYKYHAASLHEDAWEYYWYEKNLHGDIVAVYADGGAKLISYVYDAWGNVTVTYTNGGASTTATKNPFKYRGYYYDSDLGLYYLQTRYYDSNTGRFISPDDVSYLGANGDLLSYNLYAYCSNNPVMYVDPTGEFFISLSALLIGALVGAVIGGGISFGSTVYDDYKDDGEIFNGSISAREYFANTAGGFIAGAGIGVCTTLGGGLGASIIAGETLSVAGVALSGTTSLALSVGSAFATGSLGYVTRVAISDTETFQIHDMFIEGGANAFSGSLSFVAAMCGGVTGVKTPGVKNGWSNFLKYHGASLYFGVYPSKYVISRVRNSLQETY